MNYRRLVTNCQAGASVNACDSHMRTPLAEAVEKGHMTIVEVLLKAGAIVDHKVRICPSSAGRSMRLLFVV